MNDWTLTPEQVRWMKRNRAMIEHAYRRTGASFDLMIAQVMQQRDYAATFGEMPWDEAIDRWETMRGHGGEVSN